jgi:hypothetical protein
MEITDRSQIMQRFLREGESSSSACTRESHTEHPDKATLLTKKIPLQRTSALISGEDGSSTPGTATSEFLSSPSSTSLDQDLSPKITADNPIDNSDQGVTQSLDSWQTQFQHLYALLDNFQSEFNSKLEELRAGIPLPLETPNEIEWQTPRKRFKDLVRHGQAVQDSSETALYQLRSDSQRLGQTTAVVVVEKSPHTSAGDGGDNFHEKEDYTAAVQPSPSHSLMGFFEPSSNLLRRQKPPNLRILTRHVASRDWDPSLLLLRLLLLFLLPLWVHGWVCLGYLIRLLLS